MAAEKREGFWRGGGGSGRGGSAEQVGATSLFIFILFIVKKMSR